MSESLGLPNPNETQGSPPVITQEFAQEWLSNVDEMHNLNGEAIFGQPTTLDLEQGAETVTVEDAIMGRQATPDGDYKRLPVVVLKRTDGSLKEVPATDFLSQGNWAQQFMTYRDGKAMRRVDQEAANKHHQTEEDVRREQQEQDSFNKRAEIIFTPILRPENPLPHPGYDHIFSDDPELKIKADEYNRLDVAIGKQRQEHDRYVTEKSRQHAAEQLQKAMLADSALAEIIKAGANQLGLTEPLQIVDALRTNPELRLKTGKYLMRKVDLLVKNPSVNMPQRVVNNTEKQPRGLTPLIKMGSRGYAALLSMAKIDGSFNPDLADNIFEYDASGTAQLGQHRSAAEIVLGSPAEQGSGFYPQIYYMGEVALDNTVQTGNYDHLFKP